MDKGYIAIGRRVGNKTEQGRLNSIPFFLLAAPFMSYHFYRHMHTPYRLRFLLNVGGARKEWANFIIKPPYYCRPYR